MKTTTDHASCPTCGQLMPVVRATESALATEALVDGQRSMSDTAELLRKALGQRERDRTGTYYAYVYIADFTATDVVYSADGDSQLYQCTYAIDDADQVTLGEAAKVVRTYAPDPRPESATESATGDGVQLHDRMHGRVVEAKGTDKSGGRVYRVRIIKYGESRNNRRYSEAVLRASAGLYEGARAYDHHRTDAEMATGSIEGLSGYYRNVEAEDDGLYGDLHLLPSATKVAEALDASLAAQEQGLPLLVGISHDIRGLFRPVSEGGRTVQDLVSIVDVASADVVATPAAGGQATRAVAGGDQRVKESTAGQPAPTEEKGTMDPKKLRKALGLNEDATDAQVREALGLPTDASADQVAAKIVETLSAPAAPPAPAPVPQQATESAMDKTSFIGGLMIKEKVKAAGLPDAAAEAIAGGLPDRITEAAVDAQIAGVKAGLAVVERAGLAPTVASTQVTQESQDKKRKALDAFFAEDWENGYRSFKEAFVDWTGKRPSFAFGEDFNRTIMRESCMSEFDSALRTQESLQAGSWALALGDSITRRMVAEYDQPDLQDWQEIVSSSPPVNDFRQQKIDRIGGYGLLPTVAEGAPYQPLTSPDDEEAVYEIIKRGGTEDLTFEMIANDDVRAISNIPKGLGLAAAITLHRFVWDMLTTNVTCTYDSTALFHANHSNTDTAALSQSALSTARKKMRQQAQFGNAVNKLSLKPVLLVVPSALEELAFKLTTSAVGITSGDDATTPNIHQRMRHIVLDHLTDDDDWYAVADKRRVPTIEVGFYQGRKTPELFTQGDPRVGSMFNADVFTYKIRHIYSGTVLDHRGFYRGVQ